MPNARDVLRSWRNQLVDKRLPDALAEAIAIPVHQVASNAPVDRGDLRDSVHSTPIRKRAKRISTAVVVSSPHALAVEYGTSDTAPQPFFRPGIRASLAKMRAVLKKLTRP